MSAVSTNKASIFHVLWEERAVGRSVDNLVTRISLMSSSGHGWPNVELIRDRRASNNVIICLLSK